MNPSGNGNFVDIFQAYFVTLPDGHMLNMEDFKGVRANITTIRLMMDEDIEAKNIISKWKQNKNFFNAEQLRHAQNITATNRLKVSLRFHFYCCLFY